VTGARGRRGDCHTPRVFLSKPDFAHPLSGSDVEFEALDEWTEEHITTAFTRGIAPDGTHMIPTTPFSNFAALTVEDKHATAVHLQSGLPMGHAVPRPTGPGEKTPAPRRSR